MSEAVLRVLAAGPHVTIQDGGRPGFQRFGVPASGPLDRVAFRAANLALGSPPEAPAVEISPGGLVLRCESGAFSFAAAGGGFLLEQAGERRGVWTAGRLRAGEVLRIRPGRWGSWCYLAFAGRLRAEDWLGSAATHAFSGFGGGRLTPGRELILSEAEIREEREGDFPCPVFARPRSRLHATLGPQERFFAPESLATLFSKIWRVTDSRDRMGVRLSGPALAPLGALDMPSEPLMRGSLQVSGDGAATLLLADHQTTGGYPKIATILDCDLDGFAQLRPGEALSFQAVQPEEALRIARLRSFVAGRYFAALEARRAGRRRVSYGETP